MITYNSITATEDEYPEEPVSISEVKAWANIDSDDDDYLLQTMITGSRQDIENETGLALVEKEVVVAFEISRGGELVMLPHGKPAITVLITDDTAATVQVLNDDYRLMGGYLSPKRDGEYKATYTVGTMIQQALKEAIKMLVTYRYNNRGDQEKQYGLPEDIERKISKYVQRWL